MKTKRLIASISYNTPEFLRATLQRLRDSGVIDWGHWIYHKAEEDEEKDHAHLVVMPSRQLDTNALSKEFQQLDPEKPEKPLGVIQWRFCSSLDDWLLYGIHDPGYLASKAQVRRYHYSREEMVSTDPDLLGEQWREVNLAKYGLGEQVAAAAKEGVPWDNVLCSGLIPPAQWTFWREVYFSVKGGAVPVKRKELTHTPKASQDDTQGKPGRSRSTRLPRAPRELEDLPDDILREMGYSPRRKLDIYSDLPGDLEDF